MLTADLRFAFRSLRKSPLFTAVAVLSIALGIGANSAVFTLLDQALLRALPVRAPGELAQLTQRGSFVGQNTGMHSFSYPLYQDLVRQNTVFSGMFCRHTIPVSLGFQGHNERVQGEVVSGTYFPVLGVKAALGRLFSPSVDGSRDAAPYAVLGYDYWVTRFASDPNVIGKELLVNDRKMIVIGVAAKEFKGIEPLFATQVFLPVSMSAQMMGEEKPLENRRWRWLQVFGRMKPGVTLESVQTSLQPAYHRILESEVQEKEFADAAAYTRENFLKGTLGALPGGAGHSQAKQYLEAPLWALMAMVALVLLIACANMANLLIARGAARQKEMAVRLALGGSRFQLIRQLVTESLLLGSGGAVAGLAIGAGFTRVLAGILPQEIDPPIVFAVDPDWRVMTFAFCASLLTVLLFGMAPAWQSTKAALAETLKDQAGAVVGGGRSLGRKLLVSAQVSLSLLLLLNAGLFVGTLKNLRNLTPGFEVQHLLSFTVDPSLNGYQGDRAKLFYQRLSQNLATMPGVQGLGWCTVAPLSFDDWDNTIKVEGYQAKANEEASWALFNYVSPGYLGALKIPVLSGRNFSEQDVAGGPKVVIVNEAFRRKYFGTQRPIGRHIGMGGGPNTKLDMEIVGLIPTTKYVTMREDPAAQVFMPQLQMRATTQMTAFVRTSLPPDQMFPLLREAVRKVDPNLPLFQLKTEEQAVSDVLAVERLAASLSSLFGFLATLLAAIGLYGVLAFLVTRRTREIGVRMALGASRADVLRIVLREVLWLAGIGLAVGLPLALGLAYAIRSQFFGLSPFDPLTTVGAMAGIMAVAAVAGYLPARRAMQVNPISALRYD